MKIFEYPNYVGIDKSKDMYKQFKDIASNQPQKYRLVEDFYPFVILIDATSVDCLNYYRNAFLGNVSACRYFNDLLNRLRTVK